MSNTADNNKSHDGPDWMFDMDRNVIEVSSVDGAIRLFAWKVIEDSRGNPCQVSVDTLNLTPGQAIEIARRLLNAATDSKEGHLSYGC